ncbi:MAG TPA: hypothetical protein VGL94_04385 [Ktedonobacteraceae bacterium]|jgi:hypothetical protein
MNKADNFLPSTNGLHYSNNTWPNVPDKIIEVAGVSVPLGSASNGLCGGMVFAVLDLFHANRLPPTTNVNPPMGSPAFNYIVDRLLDSFTASKVAQFYEWMNLPLHDTAIGLFGSNEGISRRTITDSMSIVRQTIDSDSLCPLGLLLVHGDTNPFDLGKNHQVLVWGYKDDGLMTTVWIYDPNVPDNDNVTITFNTSNPSHTTTFNYSTGETLFGFFTMNDAYSQKDPLPLFNG